MPYTPPSGDSVDFTFSGGYTAPQGDDVELVFGIVAKVTVEASSDKLYPDTGFNKTILKWTSTESGEYRIELGGTGVTTGDLLKTGVCRANKQVTSVITSSDVTNAASYAGFGQYRINVYVKSSDDVWTMYG